mgnify:CR=1 FL=1
MIWVLARYRHTLLVKLVATMMVALAVFQLAEYNICEAAFGLDSVTWARIGFVAITVLPPLGIHILTTISKRPMRGLVVGSYSVMVVFMMIFALANHGISNAVCGGNYVIINALPQADVWYSLYYYGLEIVASVVAFSLARREKSATRRKALYGMLAAYLVLLIPTTTVNIIYPYSVEGIPSIMCGFAVFTALIVSLYVLPRSQKLKHS